MTTIDNEARADEDAGVIPVLDLADLVAGEPGAAADLGRQLEQALTDVGFFFIVNHGIDWELVRQVYDAAARLHALPIDHLDSIAMDGDHGGYLTYAGGTSYASEIAGEVRTPNLNAAFFVHRGGYRHGNRWPDLDGFQDLVDTYMDATTDLGRRILPVLAASLDLPADFFTPDFDDPSVTLRLSHYPPVDYGEHDWGLAPHTDSSIFTFLPANDVPGLEIRPAGHEWITPPALPKSFLVNSGDMLKRWTNNRFRSTAHRARNASGGHRYAIPFFFGARDDAMIEAVPTSVAPGEQPKHEADHLRRLPALVPQPELRQAHRPRGHRGGTLMDTQRERRAAALDVMTTLFGTDDPARTARSMERANGSLGSFAVDHVFGDLWSRPNLSRRDRSLVVITFLAVIGSTEELRFHTRGGLNHGLERHEIREIVNQVAGYAGFPMAMQATRIVDQVLADLDGVERLPMKEPAAPVDDPDRWAAATDVLGTLFGGRAATDPNQARAGIVESLGGVGEMAFDWGFGELWARDELSRRDRSMVTVAILAILKCEAELAIHVPAALNHGVTRDEVEEIMVQLTVYGGFPKAVEGIRAARAAFAKIDARTAGGQNDKGDT